MKKAKQIFVLGFAIWAIFFVFSFGNNIVLAGVVNINTASVSELDTLPGVGKTTAEKIISYRAVNGPFASIEDLRKVSGFGGEGKNFDKIKDFITVSGASESIATTTPSVNEDNNESDDVDDSEDEEESDGNNGDSAHYESENLSTYKILASTFAVSAGRERIAYVGAPVLFEAKYKMPSGEKAKGQRFTWSFGDGSVSTKEKVDHIYLYPGEYNVVLNGELGDLSSISRTKVKVFAPNLILSVKPDGAVEIINKGAQEINLYNWKIVSASSSFAFPLDTIISASKSVTFPTAYLKIPIVGNNIVLADSSRKAVSAINMPSLALNNKGDTITVTELQTFIEQYQKIAKTNNQTNLNTNTVHSPKMANESGGNNVVVAVAGTVTSTTTEKYWSDKYEEDTKILEADLAMVDNIEEDLEFRSSGFWSKVFHPVRTIKEAFYR